MSIFSCLLKFVKKLQSFFLSFPEQRQFFNFQFFDNIIKAEKVLPLICRKINNYKSIQKYTCNVLL